MNGETPAPDGAPRTFDVGSQRVARVYAEAFLNAAADRGAEHEAIEQLDSLIRDVFPVEPRLEAFLSSGAIGRGAKDSLIRSAFGGKASELFLNFLLVLNEHDRLDLLRAILAAARELHDERTGRVRVLVQSAVPLADDQRERLLGELRQKFRKEPVLEARVDPDLLGGMVVRVGDWLYDASVRSQLHALRDQLIERSSHEIQSRRDRFCSANGD